MQETDTIPQDSAEGDHRPSRELPEGAAYLNARVLINTNTTIGTAQSDRHQIVNMSKKGETMTTTGEKEASNLLRPMTGYAQHTQALQTRIPTPKRESDQPSMGTQEERKSKGVPRARYK